MLELHTDSAGSPDLGCGAVLRNEWVRFPWPEGLASKLVMSDITFLKFVPVVLAVSIWGRRLANRKVILNVDNLTLVSVLNKHASKSKRIMDLMRQFVLVGTVHNLTVKAERIAGNVNTVAETISRKQ